MAINLIEEYEVDEVTVRIKFEPSLRASTVTNERFSLYTDAATPVLVEADPFEPLDLVYDYNSISRIIVLSWKSGVLDADTSYKLRLAGFKNAYNQPIDDAWIEFTTGTSATPSYADPTVPEPLEIVDYSLVPTLFVGSDSSDSDSEPSEDKLRVMETNPLNFDAFLPEDYNNGVAVIKFNKRIAEEHLNGDFFIVERKPLQRKPSRWETVTAEIDDDDVYPWVYVRFPSDDATPVYDTEGKVYYDTNYKYRIRILASVGV